MVEKVPLGVQSDDVLLTFLLILLSLGFFCSIGHLNNQLERKCIIIYVIRIFIATLEMYKKLAGSIDLKIYRIV